jgi:hypothetical protein
VEGFHTLVVIDGSNPMMAENIELTAAYYTLAGDVYPFGPTHVSPFRFATVPRQQPAPDGRASD